ncbi:MAG: hypothetical protein HOC70_11915 [Gammaproteobacteria bacterium]|jgi:hypothetical protein|nr:hypothetical protein [Gammaproteobacteria bacterium]MBT4493942.1 hypothetical protein [Gammaproteobacteria bacterium]MBT7369048.1 hypothetical protein [Gammaproteobacteria bacterium]
MMEFTLCQFDGDGHIKVALQLAGSTLVARYEADTIEGVIWPAFTTLHRADGLWQSTCFEIFLGQPDTPSYLELNLSPDGGWNCYKFDDVRTGMTTSDGFEVTDIETRGELIEARVRWPGATTSESWSLGLSAVIEMADSNLQYYALSHGDKPDFHDPSRHVLVRTNDL